MVVRALAALLVTTAAAAAPGCGDPGEPPPIDDPSDALFDPDHILDIDIDVAAEDWDLIRNQSRTADLLVGADCLDAPFAKPYTYARADVVVDGERRDGVGLRKKGFFGSLDPDKPSLKIKVDELEPTNLPIAGQERLTLNNSKQDPALIRQCLGYQLFAAAGVPAPRCNFARVRLDGEPLGLFVHVEAIKKRFLRRFFDDDEGRLFEGTLSDFRPGWSGTFEIKTNKENVDTSDIDELVAALEVPDDQLLDALEPLVDVDHFLTFWAMEVLIGHWDGYANNTNNFYVYRDPTSGRFEFIPWGIDGTFVDQNPFPDGEAPPKSVFATGLLARRLYLLPETRDRYVARLRELLDTVWDEPAILAEIDRMESLVADDARTDRFGADFTAAVEDTRTFVRDRRALLLAELDSPPAWDYPLRDSFCFVEIGQVGGDFQTTFGTLQQADPFAAGTGSLDGDVRLDPIATTMVGSKSGVDQNDPAKVQTQVVAQVESGHILVVGLPAQAAAFAPGASIPLDLSSAGFLFDYDPVAGAGQVVGLILDGSVDFTAAGTGDGDPVEGTFSGTLYQSPF